MIYILHPSGNEYTASKESGELVMLSAETQETQNGPIEQAVPYAVKRIKKLVAEHYGITIEKMLSQDRTRKVVFPRQVCMYLLKNKAHLSLVEVARVFGASNHTRPLQAIKVLKNLMDSDPAIRQDVMFLNNRI